MDLRPRVFLGGMNGCNTCHPRCEMINGKEVMVEYSPSSHQLCIGIQPPPGSNMFNYYINNGWYQGCYFLDSPKYKSMTRNEFTNILKKIGEEEGFDNKDGYQKNFVGETFSSLLPQIQATMDNIIKKLDVMTPVSGWSYHEGGSTLVTNFGKMDAAYHN